MTELRSLYYCTHCKNMVEIVSTGAEALVCCEDPMLLIVPNTTEATTDKHIPVIVEETDTSIIVNIGSVDHPMLEEHHIVFIEVVTEDMVIRKELKPGMKPRAEFPVRRADVIEIREFCNIHMVWKIS